MRFIRDIIQEQRDGTETSTETANDTQQDLPKTGPMLLEDPVFPDQARVDGDARQRENNRPKLERTMSSAVSVKDGRDWQGVMAPVTPISVPDQATSADAENEPEGLDPLLKKIGDRMSDPFDKLALTQGRKPGPSSPVSPFSAPFAAKPVVVESEGQDSAPQAAEQDEPVGTLAALADAMDPLADEMPSPAPGRDSNRSGRVKTRLLGFSAESFGAADPFENAQPAQTSFPVGWLVVISDQGRGSSFALQDGVSSIGRGTDQTVCLDFGDTSISRENHLSVAFDSEQNKFFIGQSGKANLARLNKAPLLSTEELRSGDLIRLGETTLRFIAFCDSDFRWNAEDTEAASLA